jgi:hypothetical protein
VVGDTQGGGGVVQGGGAATTVQWQHGLGAARSACDQLRHVCGEGIWPVVWFELKQESSEFEIQTEQHIYFILSLLIDANGTVEAL